VPNVAEVDGIASPQAGRRRRPWRGRSAGDDELSVSIDEHKAQGYRKLFNLSELDMEVPGEQVQALAGIVNERPAPASPIAVVVADNETLYHLARTFSDITGPSRLIRVFHRQDLAHHWLDQLDGPLQ
jgi:hypothetical protein